MVGWRVCQTGIGEFEGCMKNFGLSAGKFNFIFCNQYFYPKNNFFVERTTEAGGNYNFVQGFNPGMHVEVISDEEVRIALTPFNIPWNPMVEVIFANDAIRIVRNQATEVAAVPNQDIFTPGGGNRYRITWSRQVVLVFEGNDEFPFIAYTMEDWIPVGFCGLRSQ